MFGSIDMKEIEWMREKRNIILGFLLYGEIVESKFQSIYLIKNSYILLKK